MIRAAYLIPYAILALVVCAIAELGPDRFADRVSWGILGL